MIAPGRLPATTLRGLSLTKEKPSGKRSERAVSSGEAVATGALPEAALAWRSRDGDGRGYAGLFYSGVLEMCVVSVVALLTFSKLLSSFVFVLGFASASPRF